MRHGRLRGGLLDAQPPLQVVDVQPAGLEGGVIEDLLVQRNVGLAVESIPFDFNQPIDSLPNFAVGGE